MPFGHSDVAAQAAPGFAPPMQRLPPQVTPAEQSALLLHGSAPASAHVSQKQFMDVKPGAVHFGPDASVVVPVVSVLKAICKLPMVAAKFG